MEDKEIVVENMKYNSGVIPTVFLNDRIIKSYGEQTILDTFAGYSIFNTTTNKWLRKMD